MCEHCIEDQRRYNWLTPAYSMYIYSLQNSLCVGRSSRVLREVELNIIRHEKCNQILKDIMGRIFTLVQEGGVCGYNMRGGDACQVSSWVPCHSAPLSFLQMFLSPRHWGLDCVPDPPFTVIQASGIRSSHHSSWASLSGSSRRRPLMTSAVDGGESVRQ